MGGYAVRNDGLSWRAVNGPSDPTINTAVETYSATQPSTLQMAQAAQNIMLAGAYANAVAQPVSYTSKGGVTKLFQADPQSQQNLSYVLHGCSAAGMTPAGFYWVAQDNTQVPFTYADLQGLAAAMIAQGWTAFQRLQADKTAVLAASTVSQVQAVAW